MPQVSRPFACSYNATRTPLRQQLPTCKQQEAYPSLQSNLQPSSWLHSLPKSTCLAVQTESAPAVQAAAAAARTASVLHALEAPRSARPAALDALTVSKGSHHTPYACVSSCTLHRGQGLHSSVWVCYCEQPAARSAECLFEVSSRPVQSAAQ
jgi:hypothetical protein